jgi:hypothetical protein
VASVAACLGLSASVCLADVTFNYANTPGSFIQFNGDSTFTFTPSVNNFSITSGTAVNLLGEVTGTYTIGAVTTAGGVSSAPVTGTGTFVVHDGGNDLTATLVWVDIQQGGVGGSLNVGGTVNLSGVTYAGSNPDLVALKNAGSGINVLAFQFVPFISLDALKNTVASNAFNGTGFASSPPPCNCTLTFNSPGAITNCAGDTIPNAVASEDCGNGPVSVPVAVIGAVTNGVCPQIITRTNAAVDDCGNPHIFVQTITVNCRGSVCGHIFADCDGNGNLTTGDVGLPKVTVTLIDSGNRVVGTQITDANGGYCFTNLAGGSYCVLVTPPSGYCQTAGSTSYHWQDSYGRICWQENDGYIHCLSSGTECWWDKSSYCHWKDSYGRDCWKDSWNNYHCQPCSYQSCNAQTYNNKLCVTLTNCTAQTDVDFAYAGTKACVSVSVCAPNYVKCGQTYTYTCTVTNSGNVCFTGGKVCHVVGNCGWSGWSSSCTTVYDNCPPLSPGQSCTFTHKCTANSWNYGTIGCQSSVTCYQRSGSTCGQSACYTQCGW